MKRNLKNIIILVTSLTFISCGGGNQDNTQLADDFSVSITLANLPETISYNKKSTPDGYVEYKWSVTFDINNDGVINKGDIVIQLHHFKSPGSVEKTGRISDLSSSLWLYTTDTETTSKIGVNTTISGNTITLSTNKTQYKKLNDINAATLIYFETSTYNASTKLSEYDYYPSFQTFINIPVDNQFTDASNDSPLPIIDMQSMSLKY